MGMSLRGMPFATSECECCASGIDDADSPGRRDYHLPLTTGSTAEREGEIADSGVRLAGCKANPVS